MKKSKVVVPPQMTAYNSMGPSQAHMETEFLCYTSFQNLGLSEKRDEQHPWVSMVVGKLLVEILLTESEIPACCILLGPLLLWRVTGGGVANSERCFSPQLCICLSMFL